jgi:hypothetical protein
VVENHGKIESALYGVYLVGDDPVRAKLVNHDDGVIKGTLAVGSALPLDLKNEGKLQGVVYTGEYDDKIVNKGSIKGDVNLGFGTDTFKSKGDAKSGMVDTSDGNDLVVLGDKADKPSTSSLNAATNIDTVKNSASGKDDLSRRRHIHDDRARHLAVRRVPRGGRRRPMTTASSTTRLRGAYYDPDGTGALARPSSPGSTAEKAEGLRFLGGRILPADGPAEPTGRPRGCPRERAALQSCSSGGAPFRNGVYSPRTATSCATCARSETR